MFLLPHAELDDGLLDVLISPTAPQAPLPERHAQGVQGHAPRLPARATCSRGRVVEVSSDRPFTIYADGDPIATTPATMTVESRCLRIVVPAGRSA